MTHVYSTEAEISEALYLLIELNPAVEAERDAWFTQADALKVKLELIASLGDFDRYRFRYAAYFVSEGQTFARHADYYQQEKEKILQSLFRFPLD